MNRGLVFAGCIEVVKKTLRYSNVFFYNHLYRNSIFGSIFMVSGEYGQTEERKGGEKSFISLGLGDPGGLFL